MWFKYRRQHLSNWPRMVVQSRRIIFNSGILCAILFAVIATPLSETGYGQESPTIPEKNTNPVFFHRLQKPFDLKIYGIRVIVFRASDGDFSPFDRGKAAYLRIIDLLDREIVSEVRSKKVKEGTQILIGEKGVFMILPGDENHLIGESVDRVATKAVDALKRVIQEDQKRRTLPGILQAAFHALLATAVFLAALFGIFRVRSRLHQRLKKSAENHAKKIQKGTFGLFNLKTLLSLTRRFTDLAVFFVFLFLSYSWITFCLRRFPHAIKYGDNLRFYALSALKEIFSEMIGALPDLFVVFFIFIIARYTVRLLNSFFIAIQNERIKFPGLYPETALPTRRIANVLIWAFAFVLAYPYIPGSRSEAFKAMGVFVGLIISIGSSGVVHQVISGMILMYTRAMKPGDYVRIGETEGVVISLSMFSTKIKTNKLEEVSIPNSVILGTQTKNYSRLHGEKGTILYTTVTIGYDTPWRQVHALLIQAAERTPGLRKNPVPFVNQTALSDFYVEYQLNAHLERPEKRVRTLAALHANIQDTFNVYGVQIMSPHYIDDPKEPAVVSKEKWFVAPARKEDSAADLKDKSDNGGGKRSD